VLTDYFNFITPTSPAFYSCTVTGGGTLLPAAATKAGQAQVLTVTSVLNVGQALTLKITCTNSATPDDHADSKPISVV